MAGRDTVSASPTVAVLIPCLDEAATVGDVVESFRKALPQATVYVYDNASTDDTAAVAAAAGAVVRFEGRRGKGTVCRRMLRDIDADVYVLVDGDMTYDAADVPALIAPVLSGEADMVVGDRLASGAYDAENRRPCHGFGNRLVARLVRISCAGDVRDVMTGYRAFSRRFAKTMPILSDGFQVETEITMHALSHRLAVVSVPVSYRDRPQGSVSKLNTFADGARVLAAVGNLVRRQRPLAFFGALSAVLAAAAVLCAAPAFADYAKYAYVTHVPLCIAAVGAGVLSALSLACGLVLDSLAAASRRAFEVMFLSQPTISSASAQREEDK